MDNRHVDVTSAGKEHLALALELLSNGYALSHYLEEDEQLVLCWSVSANSPVKFQALLYPLESVEAMTEFVWGWLVNKAKPREPYPDGDVKNERGAWRAWCGKWGHDDVHTFGFGRVEARYAWIGK